MVQAAIEANFTCSCGSPFIVMTLDASPNDKITALLVCPRHKVGHHITLDHSGLDLWIGVVADHLYRCAVCGRELAPPTAVSSSEVATSFTLNCPVHGTQNNTRTVWSVLHKRILSEIQQRRAHYSPEETTAPPPELKTKPAMESSETKATFCPECGKKIRPQDNFCFICGSAID
ncbi:MAG: zinc ribbon domain-containing protein [Candidatus Hermodarchaeia archaeon]|jgi:DNA-directed RNA polymerase subunit RPC12/RpoP